MSNESLSEMDYGLICLQDAKDSMDIACDKCNDTLKNQWDKEHIEKSRAFLMDHFNFIKKLMDDLNLFIKSRIEEND